MMETLPTSPSNPDADQTILPLSAATIPTTLVSDRYRIERVIGEGAFGRVYLAFDNRLHSNVAIKELLANRNTTAHPTYDRFLARFQREARAARGAQHPNIVTVYDLYVDHTANNYLVMEYVDGTNLRELLTKTGALPVERAVAIALDIASALDAVHEHEIVHRDIKPANIMLTRRGVAKLTDFGIALVAGDAQTTLTGGAHPGTPLYMSPEQAAGQGNLDHRSDLYSLGLVLFEMLAGQPYRPHCQPLHAVRPDLSGQLVAIVDRLLPHDADARYQTAAAVVHDLRQLTSAPPPVLPPAPPLPNPDPDASPRRGAIRTIVGILVVVVLGIGVYFALRPGPSDPPTPLPTAVPTIPVVPTTLPPTAAPATNVPSPTAVRTAIPPTFVPPTTVPPTTIPPTTVPVNTVPWADPNGLISVRYPSTWTVNRSVNDPRTALALDSRDGTALYINLSDPQQGSLADETQIIRRNQANDTTVAYSDVVVTDTRIAGEPAQLLTYTYAPKNNLTARGRGAWWIINHDNREFIFFAYNIGANRPTLDAIVASTALTTSWTDTKGRVRLQVPAGWTVTQDKTAEHNVLELDGPDGAILFLDLYDPAFGTLDQEVQDVLNNHRTHTTLAYKDGPVTDLRIGKEPAKTFAYTSVPKATPAATPQVGTLWEVNHGGTEFQFAATNLTTHRADIDAILASVLFLK